MAILYLRYLFDSDGLRQLIKPLAPRLKSGEHHLLETLARETVTSALHSSSILDSLFLGPPYEESEFPESALAHMTIVASRFLQPIQIPGSEGDAVFLRAILPRLGWDSEMTDRLVFGDSLCTLFNDQDKGLPHDDSQSVGSESIWCRAAIRWLSFDTVRQFHHQLELSEDKFADLLKDEPSLSQILNELNAKNAFPGDTGPTWLRKRLDESFRNQLLGFSHCLSSAKSFAVSQAG